FRRAASVTTTKCQCCRFEADGACWAIRRHSSITLRSTGRVRSSRLRTERVVVNTSSAESGSTGWPEVVIGPLPSSAGCGEYAHCHLPPAHYNPIMPQRPASKNPFDALARYYDWEHA